MPKTRILEAVRQAKGEQTAQLIDHLKKGEMATDAERLLKGTGWLPELLRRADLAEPNCPDALEGQGGSAAGYDDRVAEPVISDDGVELPAFLIADLSVLDTPALAAE